MSTMRPWFVTGGTGALGASVIPRLLRDRPCVLLRRKATELDALRRAIDPANAGSLQALEVDLADDASCAAAIERATHAWGAPAGLVHLAGSFAAATLQETDRATWDRMMSANLASAFSAMRATLAKMPHGERGRIVVVGARGALQPSPGMTAYVVSKAALHALVRQAAAELAGTGITVNAVLPDAIDTPANRASMPSATLVSPGRIAEAIAWLLSPEADGVTGALVPVGA